MTVAGSLERREEERRAATEIRGLYTTLWQGPRAHHLAQNVHVFLLGEHHLTPTSLLKAAFFLVLECCFKIA